MKTLLFLLSATTLSCAHDAAQNPDAARWKQQAAAITIVRDDWGIPHVHGKTDADAVFGMVYAQAEDDFNRVETNYINAMGRLAEAEGEGAIYRDLRMKLFINPDTLKAAYAKSPEWLEKLMVAWADGLNFYLYTHPAVKPRVITRFEPWMALSFSEGSIGGDLSHVSIPAIQAFYGDSSASRMFASRPFRFQEPSGSNGIAIAPSNTVDHHALLLINPHTSFYFRAELQMTSDEGLNAYGATTWGQFFVYQGFNTRTGWMHTTSGADVVDEYAESIVKKGDSLFYKYGSELRPVVVETIAIPYRTASGMRTRSFTVYRTLHGPIVRSANGKWISVRLMNEPLKALTQSYERTKTTSYKSYRETMELHTNSSNNTIFADADGDIAYFHANFVPIRDAHFDWRKPVDGSNPATDWKGVTSIDSSPHLLNPPNGWLYNSNNWPYSAAGPRYSPRKADYPAYMDVGMESPRGIHAIRVLSNRKDFTMQSLIDAAYDSYQPAFADLIPTLIKAYDQTPASDPLKKKVAEQIAMLRTWDYRWDVSSVPNTLACYWGDELGMRVHADADGEDMSIYQLMATRTSAHEKLDALAFVSDSLTKNFGTWKMPWGEINRFQRLTDDIVHPFNDAAPSIPVGFASARWGSLASFAPWEEEHTKKIYGTGGNSFVAVVEFGDSVRARAITAGGESGDSASKHFRDQAVRYSKGDLREVYFYPSQLVGHTERSYHPGS
ncbi:MAG TPA: penicillin acylase family protein [Gemmatimonadaceae bacterium]|nr:penicillin acylase family protein [Gemmatimonadaceae bacterium]